MIPRSCLESSCWPFPYITRNGKIIKKSQEYKDPLKSKAKQANTGALKWYFPPTSGGASYGYNDSAQEHYRKNPLGNAIREIIQNSLDAVDERRGKPVRVNIYEMEVPTSEIGGKDLAAHISKALDRTRRDKNEEGIEFFENSLKVLKRGKIKVLAITDENTTGLINKKWQTLIHDEGTSNKGGVDVAGGSYGIGKNSPYKVSAIKTLCYSTRYLDKNRQEKFIARCKICSHYDPKSPDTELQHIGFGTKAKIIPNQRSRPTEGNDIFEEFRLKKCGSGIFIVGFDPGVKDWVKVAKETIAHNFFVAIHKKQLEIIINNTDHIDQDTLDSIFESGKKTEPTRHYYHIIRDDTEIEYVKEQFGEFTVQTIVDNEDLPNRVAYVNRRGMLITQEKKFKMNPFHMPIGRGWAKYAAVVMANDSKTDKKIRAMEPPDHQLIEYESIKDQNNRETIKKQLFEIREQIGKIISAKLSLNPDDNHIQLPELATVLPISGNPSGSNSGTSTKYVLKHRQIESKPGTPYIDSAGTDTDTGSGGGTGSDSGDGTGTGETPPSTTVSQNSSIFKQRIMRKDGKLYIAFTPNQNSKEPVHFAIRYAGEDPKRENTVPITSAKVISPPNLDANIQNNSVIISSKSGQRVVMTIDLSNDTSHTGYEIVEYLAENDSGKGNKK